MLPRGREEPRGRCASSTALLVLLLLVLAPPAQAREVLKAPSTVLAEVPFQVTLEAEGQNVTLRAEGALLALYDPAGSEPVYAPELRLPLEEGSYQGKVLLDRTGRLRLLAGEAETTVRSLPGWLSLLPPLVAIALALALREVFLSLLAGVWLGALLLYDFNPITACLRTVDHYVLGAAAEEDHVYVLLFTVCLGGLIGVVARSGGMHGLVAGLSGLARGARSAQVATWGMGLLIFFDDYANSLLVGHTMRPVTDRFRISREKLSYIVDSTAAPIASVALISSWIGYEMGLIEEAFQALALDRNVYLTFLESVVYRYYSTFTLFFVLFIGLFGRDFGPMLRAERRARATGEVLRQGAVPLTDRELTELELPEGLPRRWWNALVPIAAVLGITFWGLWYTGSSALGPEAVKALFAEEGWLQALGRVFGKANSFQSLLWATTAGSALALVMAVGQRLMRLQEALSAWFVGARSVLVACSVLILAWSIGQVCKDLSTASYIVEVVGGRLSGHLLPLVVFLVAAVISFATGSSWATMGILMPLAVHLGHVLPMSQGLPEDLTWPIMVGTIASVLAGSTFGDHCSPISDTTIMSSTASAADHIDHVNTQIPYALTTAALACAVGSLPGGWGVNPWLLNALGVALCAAAVWLLGRSPEDS